MAFFFCSCVYSKKRQVEVELQQVVPPWQEGYQSGGPLGIEVWEVEGCWKYSEKVKPSEQHSVVYPTHCKSRQRRKIEYKIKGRQEMEDSKYTCDKMMTNGVRGGGGTAGEFGTTTTVTIPKPTHSIQCSSDGNDLYTESINDAREANSTPILWIKVDPNMLWIRSISLQQPDYQWVEQLFCDTGVAGQADAILGMCVR